MSAHLPTRFQDLDEQEIRRLVDSLNSLQEGELGVSMLVACGERAIGPLRDYLLHGRPMGVSEPRQRAVRALAELGAKEVLIEYLRFPRRIADPVVRFGEEAVENTAARALGKWQSDDVFEVLLRIVRNRSLPGAIESLASFERAEVAPFFIRALGDDVARRSAEDALRHLGDAGRPALLKAALSPEPSADEETPSSILRRRSALGILAENDLPTELWQNLRPLLFGSDPRIVATAARIGLRIAPDGDRAIVAQRMFDVLGSADWLVKIDIEDSLVRHCGRLSQEIEAEIVRRKTKLPENEWARDAGLAILRRVQRHANCEHMISTHSA
jgi:hypothetical protein